MPRYARRESVSFALPVLIVIAAFASASLPWLDLPAAHALQASPLLLVSGLCLVPLVRRVLESYECTPPPHVGLKALACVAVLVAVVALFPEPAELPPIYDAVWVDLVFTLIIFTATAKLFRPAARYGDLAARRNLRVALLGCLVLGGLIFTFEGTTALPTIDDDHGLRSVLVGWVPYWDAAGVPGTMPAVPFAIAVLVMAVLLTRPYEMDDRAALPIPTQRVTRVLATPPLLAIAFAAVVGIVPYVPDLDAVVAAAISELLVLGALLSAFIPARRPGRRGDGRMAGLRARVPTPPSAVTSIGTVVGLAVVVIVLHAFLVWRVNDNEALAEATLALDASLFLVGALIIGFGIDRVAKWALGETLWNGGVIVIALIRGLPVLLVFLGFFGIVEELWKIAEREPLETFGWISGLLFALTLLYLVLDASRAVSRGCEFSNWSDVRKAAAMPARRWKRPLDATPPGLMEQTPRWGRVEPLKLNFRQRVNAIVVVLAYEALVFVPVAIAAFWLFYGLGHLVVDAGLFYGGDAAQEHIALWNAKPFEDSPWTKVALLMAGFAVLYLSVHVTGQDQRELFLKVPDRELRRCFAVAAAYRNLDGPAITIKTRRRTAPRSTGDAYG